MIKQVQTFLFKNRFNNLLLFAFGFIIITLFSYFPNSRAITVLRSYVEGGRLVSDSLHSGVEKEIRDFKISDSNGEGANSEEGWQGEKLVVIDAGHGGYDPGTSGGGMAEKDISLDVALKLNAILEGKGIKTYLSRTSDTYVGVRERIDVANEKKAALFVSIHCNWFADRSLRGAMTLYYPSDTLSAGKLYEKDFARMMQDSVTKIEGVRDQGMVERPDLAVLHHAQMPAALVEIGFLSNSKDIGFLGSQEYRQKYAQALADGIEQSLAKIN